MGKGSIDKNQYEAWLWVNIQKRGWPVSSSEEKVYYKDLLLGFTSHLMTETRFTKKYGRVVNGVDEPFPIKYLYRKPSSKNSMTFENENDNNKAAEDNVPKVRNVAPSFTIEEKQMNKEANKGNRSKILDTDGVSLGKSMTKGLIGVEDRCDSLEKAQVFVLGPCISCNPNEAQLPMKLISPGKLRAHAKRGE